MATYTATLSSVTNDVDGTKPWSIGATLSVGTGGLVSKTLLCLLASPISIPDGETVTGFKVTLENTTYNTSSGGHYYDNKIKAIVGNVEVGDNLAAGDWTALFPATVDRVYGNSTHNWGTTLSASMFDTGFGIAVKVQWSDSFTSGSMGYPTLTVYTSTGGTESTGDGTVDGTVEGVESLPHERKYTQIPWPMPDKAGGDKTWDWGKRLRSYGLAYLQEPIGKLAGRIAVLERAAEEVGETAGTVAEIRMISPSGAEWIVTISDVGAVVVTAA